jgi:hypothetical protein
MIIIYDISNFFYYFISALWIIYVKWEMKFHDPWQRTGILTSICKIGQAKMVLIFYLKKYGVDFLPQ